MLKRYTKNHIHFKKIRALANCVENKTDRRHLAFIKADDSFCVSTNGKVMLVIENKASYLDSDEKLLPNGYWEVVVNKVSEVVLHEDTGTETAERFPNISEIFPDKKSKTFSVKCNETDIFETKSNSSVVAFYVNVLQYSNNPLFLFDIKYMDQALKTEGFTFNKVMFHEKHGFVANPTKPFYFISESMDGTLRAVFVVMPIRRDVLEGVKHKKEKLSWTLK